MMSRDVEQSTDLHTLGAVIVAAGKGSRMGASESKQFLLLDDKPILLHTLLAFQASERIAEMVLVTGADDVARCLAWAEPYGLDKLKQVVAGGAERQHSVWCGLQALSPAVSHVLVHDGVRPFVGRDLLARVANGLQSAEALVAAVPVKDTIKEVSDGAITGTLARERLWAMQTPQAFRRELLQTAHERAVVDGFVGTDEAVLVERLGAIVRIVPGDDRNFKITTPHDLAMARAMLQSQRETEQ
jgi:2-C-methyl-D-erythritol 4-phosphate cytidylyltransferase